MDNLHFRAEEALDHLSRDVSYLVVGDSERGVVVVPFRLPGLAVSRQGYFSVIETLMILSPTAMLLTTDIPSVTLPKTL